MDSTNASQGRSRKNAGVALIVVGIVIFVITCLISIAIIKESDDEYAIYRANRDIYKYGLGSSYRESQEWEEKMNKTEATKTVCYISIAVTGVVMALCIVGGKVVMSPPRSVAIRVSTSIGDQIKELAKLKDDGILTEEEFTEKKRELLAKL